MSAVSVTGINVKIGADTQDLRDDLGKIGTTVSESVAPAKTSIDDLRDSFKDTADYTSTSSVNIQEIAKSLMTISTALAGFAKGAIEDAIKVNPDVATPYKDISSAFDDLKVAFGEGLLSSFEGIAPTVTSTLNAITNFAKENPDTAALLLGIVGGVGALGSAAATAAPLLTLFNISLAPITGTAIAVAGAITGLVVILAYLSTTLDEIGDKASGTADDIANMDTATQKIVENGIGELSVEDREIEFVPVWDEELGDFVEQNAVWDETIYDPLTGARGYWVPVAEEASNAVQEISESVTESVTTTVETTKSTAEQATEVFQQMQESVGALSENMPTEDITEAMNTAKELVESEAYKQLAQQPIDPSIAESWEKFGASVQATSGGFSDMKSNLGDGALTGIITDIGGAAESAAAGFANLAASIYEVIDAYLALSRYQTGGGRGSGNANQPDFFKAGGGPVYEGHPYIVGEVRPEIFIPEEDGTIEPLDNAGTTINVNVGTVYGESYLRDYVIDTMEQAIHRQMRLA